MDGNIVFRWIWRFNAVALAIVLLAAGIGLALPFLAWQVGPLVESTVDTTTIGQEGVRNYRLDLDYARKGRGEIVLTLGYDVRPEVGLGSLSSKDGYGRRVVNYLFVDPTTGNGRWLFPTHRQVIASTDYFTDAGLEGSDGVAPTLPGIVPSPSKAIRAVMYDVVANPDEVAGKWRYQVYLSMPNGSALTKVLDGLVEQPKSSQLDFDSVVISYRQKGRAMVARISLTDFKPTMQQDLSAFEAE